jgi:hypothetical protein
VKMKLLDEAWWFRGNIDSWRQDEGELTSTPTKQIKYQNKGILLVSIGEPKRLCLRFLRSTSLAI